MSRLVITETKHPAGIGFPYQLIFPQRKNSLSPKKNCWFSFRNEKFLWCEKSISLLITWKSFLIFHKSNHLFPRLKLKKIH